MTDQQRLRDTLQAIVPEPPQDPSRGPEARARTRRRRRRRIGIGVGVATVLVLAGAVPLFRPLTTADRSGAAGRFVHGTGESACRELAGTAKRGPYLDDTRVVDGATAAAWLRAIHSPVDSSEYADLPAVTVCLMHSRGPIDTVFVARPEHRAEVVDRGGWNDRSGPRSAMLTLDRLRTGGAATTDGPFSCSGPSTLHYPDVSSTLPSGATAAKICGDGSFYSPGTVLTSGVDSLVRAINASRLGYTPPDYLCSPYAGAYGYTIVFQYSSGTRSVTWEPCRGMELGQFTRGGPMRLDHTFLSLLAQQERVHTASVSAEPCSDGRATRPTGVGDVRHIVAARYCAPGRSGSGQVLGGSQLRAMRQWGRRLQGDASTEPEGRCAPPAAGRPQLQLADAWGNTFTMTIVQCLAYGHERYLGAVLSPGDPHRVSYPLSEDDRDFTRLLRQLTLRP